MLREPATVLTGKLDLSVSATRPSRREGRVAGTEVVTSALPLIGANYAYVMKPPEQPKGQGWESYQSGGTLGDVGKSRALGKCVEALRPSPMSCSVHLFHVTIPELHPFIKKWVIWYVRASQGAQW